VCVLSGEGDGRVMWIMTDAREGVTTSTVVARVYGECRGMWTRGVRATVVSDEDEHALLVGRARAGARVSLDHALRGQEILDFLTEHRDVVVFLWEREQVRSRLKGERGRARGHCTSTRGAYLEPVGALLPKAKALKTETNARLASTLWVWSFITFLNERESVCVSMMRNDGGGEMNGEGGVWWTGY